MAQCICFCMFSSSVGWNGQSVLSQFLQSLQQKSGTDPKNAQEIFRLDQRVTMTPEQSMLAEILKACILKKKPFVTSVAVSSRHGV